MTQGWVEVTKAAPGERGTALGKVRAKYGGGIRHSHPVTGEAISVDLSAFSGESDDVMVHVRFKAPEDLMDRHLSKVLPPDKHAEYRRARGQK